MQTMATLAIVAVAILAGAIYIGRTAGGSPGAPAASSSPSVSASTSAQPSVSPIAAQPTCGDLKFGANLAPTDSNAGKHSYSSPPPQVINTSKKYLVTVAVAKRGTFTMCLDPQLAPNTVNNFVFLTRNKFYDGLKFHRVEPNFVIQGGDPQGNGQGGPGYKFNDEPVRSDYVAGAVAMANSGPNTNGSQFFVCTVDDRSTLAKNYNLFGFVQSGMDVVTKVAVGDVMTSVTVQEQQ